MKMSIKAFFAVALIGVASGAPASPTIELKDGSRITGEIQSLDKGLYTIVSPRIGTEHIAPPNIDPTVHSGDVPNAGASSSKPSAHDDAMTHEVQQLQSG